MLSFHAQPNSVRDFLQQINQNSAKIKAAEPTLPTPFSSRQNAKPTGVFWQCGNILKTTVSQQ